MALEILYPGHRNSWAVLTEDSFTQSNPAGPNAVAANTSTTIANQTNSTGVLGGSVAFTRPDVGNNYVGGPAYESGVAPAEAGAVRPVGLFINDAVGNAFENTPAIASGKGPYVSGMGTYKVDLYETDATNNGTLSDGTAVLANATITYTAGLLLYASENGLLTANPADSYEVTQGAATIGSGNEPTVVGVVIQAPTSSSATLVVDLRI
jgi:hypothetical protein